MNCSQGCANASQRSRPSTKWKDSRIIWIAHAKMKFSKEEAPLQRSHNLLQHSPIVEFDMAKKYPIRNNFKLGIDTDSWPFAGKIHTAPRRRAAFTPCPCAAPYWYSLRFWKTIHTSVPMPCNLLHFWREMRALKVSASTRRPAASRIFNQDVSNLQT